jgi:phage terminase Nu1 subunit (DNA packaging protein)
VPTENGKLRYLSLTQLSEVTGAARATVRRRLAKAGLRPQRQNGRTTWYDAPAAIEIILGVGDDLNPRAEKARLDRARADMAEFQLAERRNQVAPRAEIRRTWTAMTATWTRVIGLIPERAREQIEDFTEPMAKKLGEMLDATLVEIDDGRADDAEPHR